MNAMKTPRMRRQNSRHSVLWRSRCRNRLNVILAEYLASHGYIVASVSLLGPTDEQTFQSRTPGDIEATVRDMEFAWSILSEEPSTDKAKLAAMGHSVGAIEAVLFGMRNANVSAVIALDGTYAFQGLSTVLTNSYGYAPGKMRAAFLDLRRAQGAQGDEPLDLTTIESSILGPNLCHD